MKRKIIQISSIIVVVIGLSIFLTQYFMFMPWEYQKGDALYADWYEYHGEIELYLCSNLYETDEPGRYCAHITDEDIIKDVLLEFMDVDNETHSRLELQEADFPEEWGDQYIIEISRVDSRNEDGSRDEGRNLFVTYIYENMTWVNSYKGNYYFYHATDDLYDFVTNYKDENIK